MNAMLKSLAVLCLAESCPRLRRPPPTGVPIFNGKNLDGWTVKLAAS